MSRRRYRIDPPSSAEYSLGEPIAFLPEDDRVNAGKPLPPTVELTPLGSSVAMFEFGPEDDKLAKPEGRAAARRAAFLA